jgi:hypothetical protein
MYSGSTTGASFDYTCLETPVAKFLEGQANRIRRSFTNAIVQIGKDLIEAKRYLSHGQFLRWVEAEVGIPARTAQVYMRAAQWARNKGAIVAHLPPTLLYLLSAPSTPEDLAKSVLERIEEGEEIETIAVREELKKLKVRGRPGKTADERRHWKPNGIADNQVAIMEAVTIICESLSKANFARVRTLLTDEKVLRDPALSEKIAAAFDESGLQASYGEAHAKSYAALSASDPCHLAHAAYPARQQGRSTQSGDGTT